MGNIVKKTSYENPKKKEKLLKTADNSKKSPGTKPGLSSPKSVAAWFGRLTNLSGVLSSNYTPFLNFLLHQRTIGEQTHTEE